jgi:putative transposase
MAGSGNAVNTMVKTIVEEAYRLGVSKIVLGKLKGVRNNSHNGKANTMINNLWSFSYIVRRFKEKAEEYGIEVGGGRRVQDIKQMSVLRL